MYFIKYHPLKEALRDRSVTDREALPYLVAFVVMTVLVGAFPVLDEFNHWDRVSGFLSVLLAILGVLYAYNCNGGRGGFDLVQKYVIIGWVVFIRCFFVFVPLAIGASIAGETLGMVTDQTGILDVLLIAAIEAFFYQRIGKHIRDTRADISGQDA